MTVRESYVPTHRDPLIVKFSSRGFASRLVFLEVCFRLYNLIASVSPHLSTTPSHSILKRDSPGLADFEETSRMLLPVNILNDDGPTCLIYQ